MKIILPLVEILFTFITALIFVTEQELYFGLKKGDKKCIKIIYASVFPYVKNWVINNKGSEADAHDVFQESLEAILLKEDNLNTSIKGLLSRIAKNKWIDQLRLNKKNKTVKDQISYLSENDNNGVEEIDMIKKHLKYKLMEKHFSTLSPVCQQLMQLLKQGMKIDAVVKQMRFSNANSMYRRKAACIKRWTALIKEDHNFKTLVE